MNTIEINMERIQIKWKVHQMNTIRIKFRVHQVNTIKINIERIQIENILHRSHAASIPTSTADSPFENRITPNLRIRKPTTLTVHCHTDRWHETSNTHESAPSEPRCPYCCGSPAPGPSGSCRTSAPGCPAPCGAPSRAELIGNQTLARHLTDGWRDDDAAARTAYTPSINILFGSLPFRCCFLCWRAPIEALLIGVLRFVFGYVS